MLSESHVDAHVKLHWKDGGPTDALRKQLRKRGGKETEEGGKERKEDIQVFPVRLDMGAHCSTDSGEKQGPHSEGRRGIAETTAKAKEPCRCTWSRVMMDWYKHEDPTNHGF